jgi:hypothetical protein
MTYKITHKNSTVSGTPPTAGDIDVGEIAINAADAELYTKDSAGNIRKFQNTTTGTAAGVRFTQSGTGAVQRTVESKLQDVVSVKDFGAVGDGVTDDTVAIQAAVAYTESLIDGGVVYFPVGHYIVSSGTITHDRSGVNYARGRVSFKGADQNGSKITYSGPGNSCFYIANAHSGGIESNASYSTISDLTIIGNVGLRANSRGIHVNLGSFMKMERLNVGGFETAVYLQDVDQYYAEKLTLRWNKRGINAAKNISPVGTASTQPNNHTYISCTIANNSEYGGLWTGGSELNFIGGDVEYNGSDASGWGLKFVDCGYEGGRGANLVGVYIEGNKGRSDIILVATTVESSPLVTAVHQISSSFKRLPDSSGRNCDYHIECAFGNPATVGKQQLVLVGSSFRAYPGYTPDPFKSAVIYTVTPANSTNFFDLGSYYQSSVEQPKFTQNLNKKDLKAQKNTNQTFTSGAAATWNIDTVMDSTSYPLWSPTISSSQIVIDESGAYQVSARLILSSNTSGSKFLRILRNGGVIGVAEVTATYDAVTCSISERFDVGDTITFNFLQVSGGNVDVVGSTSWAHVSKIF